MNLPIYTSELKGVTISTDTTKIDLNTIREFLNKESYWGINRTMKTVKTTVENSYSIGVYKDNKQIGYARLVTDYAIFAYMADVFILPEEQGKGYGKDLMQFITNLPFVKQLRYFCLATRDAHGLYAQYGFKQPDRPDRLMELKVHDPEMEALINQRFNFN